MKMFVWHHPYQKDLSDAVVVAVAESEQEARLLAERTASRYSFGTQDAGVGRGVTLGPPDRVVDVPCAEWHEWGE